MDVDEEWAADDEVFDNLKAKVLALKVFRNRSLAHSTSEKALEISTPVLELYTKLLDHNGSLAEDVTEEYA